MSACWRSHGDASKAQPFRDTGRRSRNRAGHGAAETDLAKLSPDYSEEEISRLWEGNEFSERCLLVQILSVDMSAIKELDCPLIIFAGRYDVNVNSQVAAEWFGSVRAPYKRFVWFENSAHLPMTEEPGKFLLSLVRLRAADCRESWRCPAGITLSRNLLGRNPQKATTKF